MTSVTTGRPVSSRTSARIFRPSSPSPWYAYGEVRGLNAPPRSSEAPAALAVRADGYPADLDDRAVRVVLPADQLVGHRDADHVEHPRPAPQVERAELIHV